jgi:hypothetical protein
MATSLDDGSSLAEIRVLRSGQAAALRGFAPHLLLFTVTLVVYLISPNHQMSDSQYSMLLSQSLLQHQSFTLDEFKLPRHPPQPVDGYFANGSMYQLEVVDNHPYHHFPPGSPLLSLPYVGFMSAMGIAAARPDGTYHRRDEMLIQASLAALLMSVLVVVFFHTARQLLPERWAILLALAAAFGTQLYSSASRGVWSDTWGVLLLGLAILLLLRNASTGVRMHPVLLATLLAWMYFCRPNYAADIVCISTYVALLHRRSFPALLATGMLWLVLFMAWSWLHFHSLLPSYYRPGRLTFSNFWAGLAGNLISPGRGLLVYCPVLLLVFYLLLRHRRQVPHKPLLIVALTVIVLQLLVLGGFEHWWGGHSYGPRLTTGLVPWLVLLAVLGLRAMLDAQPSQAERRAVYWVGGALLCASIAAHTVGATSRAALHWNLHPVDVDQMPGRLWDWRHPPFLAPVSEQG